MDFGVMLNRVMRAARLDVNFYNEAEADTSLNQEALMVVIIAAALSAVGGFLGALLTGDFVAAILTLVVSFVMGVVGYYIWAYVTYFVGVNFFQGTADVGELLRTLGYAYAPNALGVLSFIPCVGALAGLAGAIWALVAGFIAVRESLDFDNTKTAITVVIGWIIVFVINMVIGAVFLGGALGLGALTGALSGN